MNLSGFVMAGGRSSRLGQDKALLPWAGATLLEHAVTRLATGCQPVRVCGDRQDLAARFPGLTFVPDAVTGAGPLAGIVAALEISESDWNLFLAVDLPLLPAKFFAALRDRIPAEPQAMCILPELESRPQPLCALYHRALAPGLRRALDAGTYKLLHALRQAASKEERIVRVEMQSLADSFDRDAAEWVLNINTPEDWQRALTLRNAIA